MENIDFKLCVFEYQMHECQKNVEEITLQYYNNDDENIDSGELQTSTILKIENELITLLEECNNKVFSKCGRDIYQEFLDINDIFNERKFPNSIYEARELYCKILDKLTMLANKYEELQ